MSEELYFNDELRKCLNAAGLSDCGENDAWNYWYQRVHKAHDQAVDRVTEAQRVENAKLREEIEAAKHDLQVFSRGSVQLEAENAKLRELAAGIGHLLFALDVDYCAGCPRDDINHPCPVYTVKGGECLYETDLRELGIEVD